MSVFDLPLLFTDQDGRNDNVTMQQFHDRGWRAICGQAMNVTDPQGGNVPFVKTVDLRAWLAAGWKTGVWGVSYNAADFARDARLLASAAIKGAHSFLIWDAEQCLKGADPRPALEAFKAFPGEKAVSVLGAASGLNTYPIDAAAFIEYGWHIMAQAYTSTDVDYRPEHCIEHWVGRLHVPLDRFHLTVDSYAGDYRPGGEEQGAAEIVRDLKATGMTSPDVSVFMAEFGDLAFYDTLKEISMQIAKPEPAAPADPTSTRAAMLALGKAQEKRWRAAKQAETTIAKTRIGVADKVLDPARCSDTLLQRVAQTLGA